METTDYQRMHAQLLDMLGAKDHEDAERIIAKHHALEIASQPAERGEAVAYITHSADALSRLEMTAAGLDLGVGRHACYTAPPPAAGVPDGMLDRIDAAIQRITDGHAPRRIPADPTDVDLVLAEVRSWLTGQGWPPFWIPTAPEAKPHG